MLNIVLANTSLLLLSLTFHLLPLMLKSPEINLLSLYYILKKIYFPIEFSLLKFQISKCFMKNNIKRISWGNNNCAKIYIIHKKSK